MKSLKPELNRATKSKYRFRTIYHIQVIKLLEEIRDLIKDG